ncbi:MAG TPA: STAS domain-containing protein [Acidimicrobiales bacterium]|nr:STAS domain-containing protein [Acidimicrobiales bacterium]
MPEGLAIDYHDSGGEAVVVKVRGEVDIASVDEFRRAVSAAPTERPLVVDVDEVDYLDSAGVAVLFQRAKSGPLEVVAGPRCPVRRVLEVVALDQLATLREPRT